MDFLNNITNSLSNSLGSDFTNVLGALIILIIGMLVAKFVRKIMTKLIAKTGVDNKLGSEKVVLSKLIGKLLYFFLMIIVFMMSLEKLGMTTALEPLREMVSKFSSFIPNIIAAGLVGYIGYMLANVVSELVGLSGDTIQKFAPKLKLPENINLVTILKKVVFIFIFIPLLISALNILNLNAISTPATNMLSSFFEAIPRVLVATLILILFVVGGRFLSGLIKDLLDSLNINEVLKSAHLDSFFGKINVEKLIANIVYAFIILFGLITAIEKLEFTKLSEIMETIVSLGGNILFGLIILAIGNWIANIAYKNFNKNGDNQFVGSIIKVAVIAIFLAIGLRTMGIADDIINLAFGITLGAVALTIVLSFGLGGREAAGKQMEKILNKFNK
ncbi:mechanosensitive ion channel [Lacinutrix sp. WUR7]|uniref:mechanosensitive ion channel n=1 Tax=Lacinutrix sp. WUR7 TaxID=2653681 RepID=UPI00193EAD62|nr:mechanosensitive ion channel [Lacinutrix sp. WUR7]QRM90518.1 mechanosensitive ion channel [Lacinutrix sp. WUR7]